MSPVNLSITLDTAAYYALAAVLVSFLLSKIRKSRPPYPPGPKGLPIIGNLRDIPTSQEWLTYAKWARELDSDIIHLNFAGTHVIVVNTHDVAFDLFDKRSANYSDRPRLPMLIELVRMEWAFSLVRYGPQWRSRRKLFHQYFNANVVHHFNQPEIKATYELLQRLVHKPEEFINHIRLMASSMILNVTYGIDVQSFEDPYVINAEKTMSVMSEMGSPGSFLVDVFPLLKYVPDWMPGASFKRKAKLWRKYGRDTVEIPFNHVKDQMAKGTSTVSMTSRCLTNLKKDADDDAEKTIRDVAATAYAAGSDTTVSAIVSFFLEMTLHPEILQKAQKEIDDVLGDRLPDFSDRSNLPYVVAIVYELLRFHPITPLAFGHLATADDVYKGMFIPRDSIMLGNSWSMLNDEKTYGPDVGTFNPERFLKNGELNPEVRYPDFAFGFGRRMCPGRHLVVDSMFITVAAVLATFNISKAVDKAGNFITPTGEYTSGVIVHPKPFNCSIKPRSQKAVDLIAEANVALRS